MLYSHVYHSPLGELSVSGDASAIRGLWFSDQSRVYAPPGQVPAEDASLFDALDHWLDVYFDGRDPGTPPVFFTNGTPFQEAVWALLGQIPYGTTVTYGQMARRLGRPGAARAVGAAVGRNPVELLLPCHRVLGVSNVLTGYAGGRERKATLLELEGIILP